MKTIFITGASAGLGKATAILFQAKGWRVIATMRNPEAETLLNGLANVELVKLDVTKSKEVENVVRKSMEGEFSIDVVVNNAGYGLVGPLEGISYEQIDRQIDTNLMGAIRVMKTFIPYFRERQHGLFINITSMFGLIGYPTCSMYAATKWALEGLSESMAYELAGFGVQVKTVAPGGIKTDFAGRSMDGATNSNYGQLVAIVSEGYSEEKQSMYSSPESIAEVVYSAATDGQNQLRYIAGQDAVSLYENRLAVGPEAHFRQIKNMFV